MNRGSKSPSLVIIGASVRSLAASAVRVGWRVYTADLFADLDLRAIADHASVVGDSSGEPYPWSLRTAVSAFPEAAPWCYTGAIENHPDLIEAISATRPLAGTPADVVRKLRDPWRVAAAARRAGLGVPETLTDPAGIPEDGTFLVKPLAGAGGRGVRHWTATAAREHRLASARDIRGRRIWQRFVAGAPVSASYCVGGGSVRLFGVSRQLLGERWCGAREFTWCGATTLGHDGPVAMAGPLRSQFDRLGAELVETFGPCGVLGVDAVVDRSGRVIVIEVNPRPTASMELFERQGAGSVARDHLEACGLSAPDTGGSGCPVPLRMPWAKAVVFAAGAITFSPAMLRSLWRLNDRWSPTDGDWPALADVPVPGQVLAAGAPVVTVFAPGRTAEDAVACLRGRVAAIDTILNDEPARSPQAPARSTP